jgi:hypothetical protein
MPLHGPSLSLSEFTSAWKRSVGSDVRPGMSKIVNIGSVMMMSQRDWRIVDRMSNSSEERSDKESYGSSRAISRAGVSTDWKARARRDGTCESFKAQIM